MDPETTDQMKAALQGMGVDEIKAAIMASKHAGKVADPDGFAQYVADLVAS